jgi:hypothetical protein
MAYDRIDPWQKFRSPVIRSLQEITEELYSNGFGSVELPTSDEATATAAGLVVPLGSQTIKATAE